MTGNDMNVDAGPAGPDFIAPAWTRDRLRHKLRQPLSRVPYAWDLAVQARPGKRATLVGPHSALLIEGFLRSGNTYSAAAFLLSNGEDVLLARHLHAGAHVLRAVRLGVPALVLAREPVAAVASYLVRRPTLTAADGLAEYVDFYRTAWRARAGFEVALFDEVVADFGAVVDRVNRRFGCSFQRYLRTPENEAATTALVDEMNRKECGGRLVETHVGRPSAARVAQAAVVRTALEGANVARRRAAAEAWYERYVSLRRCAS